LFQAVIECLIQIERLPKDKIESFCELGEFVSAAADNGKYWIVFKKLLVQYLRNQGREDEADAKIAELRELGADIGNI
jgi:hypothetical protein